MPQRKDDELSAAQETILHAARVVHRAAQYTRLIQRTAFLLENSLEAGTGQYADATTIRAFAAEICAWLGTELDSLNDQFELTTEAADDSGMLH